MNHTSLPIAIVSILLTSTSCRREHIDLPAPVSSHAATSDQGRGQGIPADSLSATQPTTKAGDSHSSSSEAPIAAGDTLERARQELRSCGAFENIESDMNVDRKAMPIVSSWLEAYRALMGSEADPRVASNSKAKRALLCEPDDAGNRGSCDSSEGSFVWAKIPWLYAVAPGSSALGALWNAHVIVRRSDGKFALITLETTDLGNGCGYGRDGNASGSPWGVNSAVSFERGEFIHVRAHYTMASTSNCVYHRSHVDVLVDPITGDRVFWYSQQVDKDAESQAPSPLSELVSFPIESVSVVDHQAILTGPKCHVAIKLP